MRGSILKQHKRVYDALANEYEKNVPKYYTPTKVAVEILSNRLKTGASILDVGCGVGLAGSMLCDLGFVVTSVDISPTMIKYAKKRNPKINCIIGDFNTHQFTQEYDAIISLAYIHLFPRHIAEKNIKKMYNLIKSGGYLYIGTTESKESSEGWELKQDDFFPKSIQKRYRKHWTQEELKKSLLSRGFALEEINLIDDPRGKVWMDFLVSK